MNICILMPSFDEGGVQILASRLCRGFVNSGHKVTMLVGDTSGKMKNLFDGAEIFDLGKKFVKGDYKILFAVNKVNEFLKNRDYDIVLAVPGFSTAVAILAKKHTSAKVVVMVDNTLSLLRRGKLKHRISYYIYKKLYKKADVVVAAHDCAKKDLEKTLKIRKEKVKRIYHPLIDIEQIAKINSIKDSFYKDNFVILSAGRLCKEKDYPTLIRAFSIARKRISTAKLVIAGEGKELKKIEQMIKKNDMCDDVVLLGHTKEIIKYMKSADVFVLSSKQEAFGIVLVEALACNLKIISTNTNSGSQSEILRDGKYGILCNVGDYREIADGIFRLYNTRKDAKGLERAKDFIIDKSVNDYLGVFKEILK